MKKKLLIFAQVQVAYNLSVTVWNEPKDRKQKQKQIWNSKESRSISDAYKTHAKQNDIDSLFLSLLLGKVIHFIGLHRLLCVCVGIIRSSNSIGYLHVKINSRFACAAESLFCAGRKLHFEIIRSSLNSFWQGLCILLKPKNRHL